MEKMQKKNLQNVKSSYINVKEKPKKKIVQKLKY